MSSLGRKTTILLALITGWSLGGVATAQTLNEAYSPTLSVQVRDIVDIAGEHRNELMGLGVVVGLEGTGGGSESTKRAAVEILQKMGLRADPATRAAIQQAKENTDNISVVMVTAMLQPHKKIGQQIDVIVSAFDDAESLNGGQLLRTPLRGVDGEVYAMAGGSVSINGGAFGGEAATVVKNHPTSGRIPNGAIIENEVPTNIVHQGTFRLFLHHPSVETAMRINNVINAFSDDAARIESPANILVVIPDSYGATPFQFIAECLNLLVTPSVPARVVINERVGSVVCTADVRLSSVALTHGNIVIQTVESPQAVQPNAFGAGDTAVVPRTDVEVLEESRSVNVIDNTTSVGELAAGLNALGVSPKDLSSIFQALKQAGALHAQLELQ